MAQSRRMCVAFFKVPSSPDGEFVLAANRDEFLDRPSAKAAWWTDQPSILGGRDLKEGGAWLAVSREGRFGLITNYRDPGMHQAGRLSRGGIIPEFLAGRRTPERFLAELARESGRYNPFNLVIGSFTDEAWFLSSRDHFPRRLAPGVYGVSNGDFDSRWPKVVEGRGRFESLLTRCAIGTSERERFFELMEDRGIAPDACLPSTGVPLEVERALSAIFIRLPGYGTRCSTLVIARGDGAVEFAERTYDAEGKPMTEVLENFTRGSQ